MEVSGEPDFLAEVFTALKFILFVLISIPIAFLVIFFVYKFFRQFFYQKILKSSDLNPDWVFLFIKTPTTNEQKENSMEAFLKSLHRVLPNKTRLSLEMASSDQFLRFYIAIPRNLKTVFESQLYAHYPTAEVEETEDFLPSLNTNTAAYELTFKKSSLQPLNTYSALEENILKNLSALLSKTEPGEKFLLQLNLQKIGSKWWERGLDYATFKSLGKKFTNEGAATPAQIKASQDLYTGRLRVIFLSQNHAAAASKLNSIINLFKITKSTTNELRKKEKKLTKSLVKDIRTRNSEGGPLWSPAEIATLYHFPYQGGLVSNVVATNSRRAPAPDILPFEGTVDPKEISLIGETNYRNERKRFGLKRFDRRRHLYVIGKSGTGKSRLLELLLIADIQNGEGCCLLDPHGDLADEILMFVPKERINDVVYINPADRDYPIGFNPLEPVEDYEMRQHLSTFFISIFKKLFAATWNQRMEHLIRYITLALLETPDSNIMGIPRMLSDTAFRQRVIQQIQDPVVKAFWTSEFGVWNQQYANDAVVPVLNKVGQFIANPVVRNVVGQRKNNLDFSKFMNEGKIVIINISKGKLGDDNAALLGSMFITKIQQAALARAHIKEEERRDFYFYVDEFQNFATDAFSTILSEARKYRLDLTIAHQYIAQLPEGVKATAFGNVGSIVSFSVGADDAAYLSKEFAPIFSPDDLIGLNNREMYIKMSIDGKITPPFSARTIDVPKPQFDYSQEIFDHSRLTYGKHRVTVENEIARWSSTSDLVSEERGSDKFPEPIV